MDRPIPESLLEARRPIDALDWVTLLEDWKWDDRIQCWYIHLAIKMEKETYLFPQSSEWYFVAYEDFPYTGVDVFPAVNNSIITTLYHQSNNNRIECNGLWRSGKICVAENTLDVFQDLSFGSVELFMDTVFRAYEWLNAAASNKLISVGDRFELPDFGGHTLPLLIYKEDEASYSIWKQTTYKYGVVRLQEEKNERISIARATLFYNLDGDVVLVMKWGSYFARFSSSDISKASVGAWIMLDSIPVVTHWQTPISFGELAAIFFRETGEHLSTVLERIIESKQRSFRDGESHLCLIGFPIPEKFGDSCYSKICWQAISLPPLGRKGVKVSGFRDNEEGYKAYDKKNIFAFNNQLTWMCAMNWDSSEITQRGRLDSSITDMKVLIVGAGCIGSLLAEAMAREGVNSFTIIDDDLLDIGNLSRHTLTLDDYQNDKAFALCERLASINPNISVRNVQGKLNNLITQSEWKIKGIDFKEYDMVLDCSASPFVMQFLTGTELKKNCVMAHVSMSLNAEFFFIFISRGPYVDFKSLSEVVNRYTEKDRNISSGDLAWEGTGCWHPAFPARYDDIVIGVSGALKTIEEYIVNNSVETTTYVYHKKTDKNEFGYSLDYLH